jgi:hypothetical protein
MVVKPQQPAQLSNTWPKKIVAWTVSGSLLALVAGCATTPTAKPQAQNQQTSPPTTQGGNHQSGQGAAANTKVTLTELPSTPPPYGWTYLDASTQFGRPVQVWNMTIIDNTHSQTMSPWVHLGFEALTKQGTSYDHTLIGEADYSLASSELSNAQKESQSVSAQMLPAGGDWSLHFTIHQIGQPVQATLVQSTTSVPIPSSIPMYSSGMNPEMDNPGELDNRVLGQTGHWVWLALKGPAHSPLHTFAWHYRYWNRIVAVNVVTQQAVVYPIPRETSPLYTWTQAPLFAKDGTSVLIGIGEWLGDLPANPAASLTVPVLQPEPAANVQKDTTSMLETLRALQKAAATGLADTWNVTVSQDTADGDNGGAQSWVMNPAIMNHGDYPQSLLYAAEFPTTQGSAAADEQQTLLTSIMAMLHSPLTTAWVEFPSPSAERAHFHDTPPTELPGYVIKGGLYVPD